MVDKEKQDIIQELRRHLQSRDYPCIAAHDAASKQTLSCFVADHMACPKDDHVILKFIYEFIDNFRAASKGYHSVAIIFKGPLELDDFSFDKLLWQRLQSLADLDALHYNYDPRVDKDVSSTHFSFSMKEEAFYIIGLHPSSKRAARNFKYPTLVFNPHAQFEKLRDQNHYTKMQAIVREREMVYSGSVNPMLTDFGESSEVFQYSGNQYDKEWKCPLQLKHGTTKHHTSS